MNRVAAALGLLAGWAVASGCSAPASPLAPAAPVAMYPTPRYVEDARVAVAAATACLDPGPWAEALADFDARRAALGLAAAADGADCELTLAFDRAEPPDLASAARAAWDAAGSDRYIVSARVSSGRVVARLWAEGPRAARFAVAAALARYDRALYHPGLVVDGAPIAERGVVEGHYGPPLAPDERACLLEAMARLHGNVYLYAPKDDPFHRARWADPYPPDQAQALADTAAIARARGIDFIWSVSPGTPEKIDGPGGALSYSSAADFARLIAKIESVRALGVDRFALLLDDTARDFSYDADRAAYPTLAAAHADLANRLDAWLVASGAPHLWLVGTFYTSYYDGWRDYNRELGARLDSAVGVMWTGPHVYSESIAAADLHDIDALLLRKVIIWDNEPEAPVALEGRAHDLPDGARAYLTNTVMIQRGYVFADLFRVLGPVADYAWNPRAYDPVASLSAWSSRVNACP